MCKFLLIAIVPFLTSCATMETEYSKSSPYAPVNEIHGGIVSYNNQGFGANGRRESAYRKMHDYCNGDYKIVDEMNTLEGGMAQTLPGYGGPVTWSTQQKVVKIKFECLH